MRRNWFADNAPNDMQIVMEYGISRNRLPESSDIDSRKNYG
jgi:hypothetical protein